MKDVYESMADDINITMKNDLVAEHGFVSIFIWPEEIAIDNYILYC